MTRRADRRPALLPAPYAELDDPAGVQPAPARTSVAELRVKHQLLLLDARQLAFEDDEVQALLELGVPVSINREQVERLNRRIGGWPCALQLALQEVQTSRGMDRSSENLQLGHRTSATTCANR